MSNSLDQLLARVQPRQPQVISLEEATFSEVKNLYARDYLQKLVRFLVNLEPGNKALQVGFNLDDVPEIWDIWVSGLTGLIREQTFAAIRALPSPIENWKPIRDVYVKLGVLYLEVRRCNDIYTIAEQPIALQDRRRSLSPQRRSPPRRSPSSSPSLSPPPRRSGSRRREERGRSPHRSSRSKHESSQRDASSAHRPKRESPQRDASSVRSIARFILGS
jgi:hypothetical protein